MQGDERHKVRSKQKQSEEQMQMQIQKKKTRCKKIKKHKLTRQKKPLEFYIPLFSWSPLVEATP
jgi:hypothetical protein